MSALISAVRYKNQIGYIEKLIERGVNVNEKDYEGYTALMVASGILYDITANVPVIELLIKHGADINAVGWRQNITALIAASGFQNRSNLSATELLIKNGANVNAVDIYGNTPLMYSAGIQMPYMANFAVFKLLLKHGADINIVNNKNQTVCTILDNSTHFRLAINKHNRKELLTYLASINHSYQSDNKIGMLFKIISHNKFRQHWKMHISSFLSNPPN
jgi:hypothetical protein